MDARLNENVLERIKLECLPIRTVEDLEQYAYLLPVPIGAFLMEAIQFFLTPCIKIVSGVEELDWPEVRKRRILGSRFLWIKGTVITKDMYRPLYEYISSHPQFYGLSQSSLAASISAAAGYGPNPAIVLYEILRNIRDNVPYLTENYVQSYVKRAKREHPDKKWTKKELRMYVLRGLIWKYQLPFRMTNGWNNPDWEHPEVRVFVQELDQFIYLFL